MKIHRFLTRGLVVVIGGLVACSESGPTGGAASGAGAWSSDTAPMRSIGAQPGDSTTQFHAITAIGLLSDGSVAVADESSTLRVFDEQGRLSRSYGRPGAGPGDFRRIVSIVEHHADTLRIYDQDLQRLSFIARSTGNVSTQPVPLPAPLGLVGYASGGTMVLGPLAREWRSTGPNTEAGLLSYVVVHRDGRPSTTIGDVEGPSHFVMTFPDGGRGQAMIPFSSNISAAVRDTIVYVTRGDTDSILRYGLSGIPLSPVIVQADARPVTSEDWDGYIDSRLASIEDESRRRERRQHYAAMNRPARHPEILNMLVSENADVWIQRNASAGQPARWDVMGSGDTLTGVAHLPPGLEIMAIGADRVAGIATDGDGVQSVQVFRLLRQ